MCFTNAHANKKTKEKNREKGAARTAKFINTATTVVIQKISQARPSHWLSRMVVGGLKKA